MARSHVEGHSIDEVFNGPRSTRVRMRWCTRPVEYVRVAAVLSLTCCVCVLCDRGSQVCGMGEWLKSSPLRPSLRMLRPPSRLHSDGAQLDWHTEQTRKQ